jgi:hypothetical protein
MQRAESMHLMQLDGQGDEPAANDRAALGFALLGHGAVALLGLIGLALLAAAARAYLREGAHAVPAVLGLVALVPLWLVATVLSLRSVMPTGYRIERAEAPDLFRALSRIRRAMKAPALDAVLIDERFGVSVVQTPRAGIGLLGHVNTLVIGWPVLCTLEAKRFYAIVAHEYGHLRGGGGAAAWVCRDRIAWRRLQDALQARRGVAAWVLRRTLTWYLPRLNDHTFALARRDDYEAGRLAAKLCGAEVVGHAWNELEIKSRWYEERHWRDVWRRAVRQERPEPMPYADMRRRLRKPPDEGFAQEALRRALQRLPHHDDAHPVVRERLAALGVMPGIPDWSRRNAVPLLGSTATRIVAQFDERWWAESRRDWARQREQQQRCLERVQALKARAAQLSADEWVDWADCFEALSADDSSVLYEHALHRNPNHATALRRLAERRAETVHPDAMPLFERLVAGCPQHAFAACELALQWLDRREHAGHDVSIELRRQWKEQRARFEKLEQEAWAEFSGDRPCDHTREPECTDAERRRIVEELIRTPQVKAAWLAGKQIGAIPQRAYLVLIVELTRPDESLAQRVGEQLMRLLPFEERLRVAALGVDLREQDLDHSAAVSIYRRQGQ